MASQATDYRVILEQIIGRVLDRPGVYVSGASKKSLRQANAILDALSIRETCGRCGHAKMHHHHEEPFIGDRHAYRQLVFIGLTL